MVNLFSLGLVADSLSVIGAGLSIVLAIQLRARHYPLRDSFAFLGFGAMIVLLSSTFIAKISQFPPEQVVMLRIAGFVLSLAVQFYFFRITVKRDEPRASEVPA